MILLQTHINHESFFRDAAKDLQILSLVYLNASAFFIKVVISLAEIRTFYSFICGLLFKSIHKQVAECSARFGECVHG